RVEQHGAYAWAESQRDRVLMRVRMGYPSAESEKEIVRKFAGSDPLSRVEAVMSAEEVVELQQAVRGVSVDEQLVNYSMAIVEKTRRHEYLVLGVSPRGTSMHYRAAEAMAFI